MTVLLSVAFVIAGCRSDPPAETPLHKADRHYTFLKSHGADVADLCEAARQAKDAAVDARDDLAFMQWRNVETQNCHFGLIH